MVAPGLSTDGVLDRRLRVAAGGVDDIETALRTIVRDLLKGQDGPSTDLAKVAAALQVRVDPSPDPDLPVAALLARDDNGLRVAWAAHQNLERRRFTIAHELAHAYLELIDPDDPPPRVGRAVERVCDRFAAELLMPTDAFIRELADGVTIDLLYRLCERFGTSLRATAIRCAALTPLVVFVADSRDLLWTTDRATNYSGFLRATVRQLLSCEEEDRKITRHVNREGVRGKQDPWRLEGGRLKGGRDVMLLLTPDNPETSP